MIGGKSNLEKAQGAVTRNEGALERSTRRLNQHDANRPAGDDADANFLWRRERRDLEDRVEADRESLAFSREALSKAEAVEETRARRDRHAKLERDAEVAKKRIAAIVPLQQKLADELAWLRGHVTEIEHYNRNERPASLPFVTDGEYRLRAASSWALMRLTPVWPIVSDRLRAFLRSCPRDCLEKAKT